MSGADCYDVKAAAGWSRTRPDGSSYDRRTDDVAEQCEAWFAQAYGGVQDDRVGLSGDSGYDVAVERRGVVLKVDVVHAGVLADGMPRPGRSSSLIVNLDANKLVASDVLVLVEGPPFVVVGCIYTARFLALASVRDHGDGKKLSLDASRLLDADVVFGRRRATRAT